MRCHRQYGAAAKTDGVFARVQRIEQEVLVAGSHACSIWRTETAEAAGITPRGFMGSCPLWDSVAAQSTVMTPIMFRKGQVFFRRAPVSVVLAIAYVPHTRFWQSDQPVS